jgi:hypothetical protein
MVANGQCCNPLTCVGIHDRHDSASAADELVLDSQSRESYLSLKQPLPVQAYGFSQNQAAQTATSSRTEHET